MSTEEDDGWEMVGYTDEGQTFDANFEPTVTVELADWIAPLAGGAVLTGGVLHAGGALFESPGSRVWISGSALGLPDGGAAQRRERSEPPNEILEHPSGERS